MEKEKFKIDLEIMIYLNNNKIRKLWLKDVKLFIKAKSIHAKRISGKFSGILKNIKWYQ